MEELFPFEIIWGILRYLPINDLVSYLSTNRKIYDRYFPYFIKDITEAKIKTSTKILNQTLQYCYENNFLITDYLDFNNYIIHHANKLRKNKNNFNLFSQNLNKCEQTDDYMINYESIIKKHNVINLILSNPITNSQYFELIFFGQSKNSLISLKRETFCLRTQKHVTYLDLCNNFPHCYNNIFQVQYYFSYSGINDDNIPIFQLKRVNSH